MVSAKPTFAIVGNSLLPKSGTEKTMALVLMNIIKYVSSCSKKKGNCIGILSSLNIDRYIGIQSHGKLYEYSHNPGEEK